MDDVENILTLPPAIHSTIHPTDRSTHVASLLYAAATLISCLPLRAPLLCFVPGDNVVHLLLADIAFTPDGLRHDLLAADGTDDRLLRADLAELVLQAVAFANVVGHMRLPWGVYPPPEGFCRRAGNKKSQWTASVRGCWMAC